jgi:hypothetical protein
MTELERARAHLRFSQNCLFGYRQWCGSVNGGSSAVLQGYEQNVLAALSWVWEEQRAAEMITAVVQTETGMAITWKERGKFSDFPRHAFA